MLENLDGEIIELSVNGWYLKHYFRNWDFMVHHCTYSVLSLFIFHQTTFESMPEVKALICSSQCFMATNIIPRWSQMLWLIFNILYFNFFKNTKKLKTMKLYVKIQSFSCFSIKDVIFFTLSLEFNTLKLFVETGPSTQLNNGQIMKWDPMIHKARNKSGNPWALSARRLMRRLPPQLTLLTMELIQICD